jgi:hypothetical protein
MFVHILLLAKEIKKKIKERVFPQFQFWYHRGKNGNHWKNAPWK